MSKWADYAIYAVHFNSKHTHIDRLSMFPDLGDELGAAIEKTRQEVLDLLEDGYSFITTFKKDGTWKKGRLVHRIKVGDEYFLQTSPNRTREDNLDELPEY